MKTEEFLNSLKDRHKPIFIRAIQLASEVDYGVGKRGSYRLASVVVDKRGKILGEGVNSYKTHPFSLQHSEYPYLHAERAAIIACKPFITELNDFNIYTVRIKKDGSIGLAMPCESCMMMLEMFDCRGCYFTTETGWDRI